MVDKLRTRRRPRQSLKKEPDRGGRYVAIVGWVSGAALAAVFVAMSSSFSPNDVERFFAAGNNPPAADTITTGSIGGTPPSAFEFRRLQREIARLHEANEGLRAENLSLARRVSQIEKLFGRMTQNGIDGIETGSIGPTDDTKKNTGKETGAVKVTRLPFDPTIDFKSEMDRTSTASVQPIASTTTRTQFGADLGSSASLSDLRKSWEGLRGTFPRLLAGASPIAAVRETDGKLELRLIVGPFVNAADVASLCAQMRPTAEVCATSVYEGQRLASK